MNPAPSEALLSLNVTSVDALLDAAGSPLAAPHIHPEAADALRTQAQNATAPAFRITITVPAADLARGAEVEAAVRENFLHEQAATTQSLRELYRDARKSTLVGVGVGALLLLISELLLTFGGRPMTDALGRAMIIFAWVALWHPADLWLYANLPLRRRRRLAVRIAEAKVTLQPTGDGKN